MKTHVEDVDKGIRTGLLGTEQQRLQAIETAYERYARPLQSHIREKVAPALDDHEIATAVNDAFRAVADIAAKGKLRTSGSLMTLLFTIGRRKAYSQWRIKKRYDEKYVPAGLPGRSDEINDEEFATLVTARLADDPKLAAQWRTAADTGAANEIFRIFKLWLGGLPRLQRKVAQVVFKNFGCITNPEIVEELAKIGVHATEASVKSARKQITEKFEEYIKSLER